MDKDNYDKNILKGYNMLLYFAGTMIMYEPSEECITDFWTKGILKTLPVSSSNPNFIKAASQLRDSCLDNTICNKILIEDYTRLFTRKKLPLAPAYESYYTKNKTSGTGVNKPDVIDFYNSYGWKSKFKGRIKDDHLGVELLFLTLLIDKYIVLDDNVCQTEMRNEIRRYIDLHILSWIKKWNEKVQAHSNTMCFKGISTLILACIEDIISFMVQKNTCLN